MKYKGSIKGGETKVPKIAIMLSLLTTILLLASCNEPLRTQMSPAECDQVLATSARKVLATKLNDIEQLVQTITATYEITPDKVVVYDETAQDLIKTRITTAVRWQSNDYRYGIDIATDQLVSFQIGYNKHPPNVNNILLCLGAPNSYLAWYGFGTSGEAGMGLLLKLFYPEKGVIVTINVNTTFADTSELTAPIPTDAARLPVGDIRFSMPRRTSAELLQDYLAIDLAMDLAQEPDQTILAWYEQLLWPWPSDVHQLEYSTLAYPDIPLVSDQPNP